MANPLIKVMEQQSNTYILEGEPMTIIGSVNKTLILLLCVVLSACYTWGLAMNGFTDMANMLTSFGIFAGIVLCVIIVLTRKAMHILTPLYALSEGLFLGGASAVYAGQYAGIVTQAVILTFAVLFMMLVLYSARIIRCTEKFRATVYTATSSIAIVYLIQIVANLFDRSIPQIFTASPIGIGFSVLVVLVATLNLILDFDIIERGANLMLPKKYEWYGAFGLMVSLIWLYLEILRLLAKVNSRR